MITIDDKKYKEHHLEMFATSEAENALIMSHGKFWWNKRDQRFTQEYLKEFSAKAYHLYVLSDEKPKEKDWVMTRDGVFQVQKNDQYWEGKKLCDLQPWHKKIIATTDKSLSHEEEGEFLTDGITVFKQLYYSVQVPQIPQSFVDLFIEKHNSNFCIKRALVEYEGVVLSTTSENDYDELRLKIDEKNEITILVRKSSWNREELIEELSQFSKKFSLDEETRKKILHSYIAEKI